MPQPVLFAPPANTKGAHASTSKQPTLKLDQVKTQWDAFQALRRYLETMIDRLGDVLASANQIHDTFGITPTTVRRLAAGGKVRRLGRRRKRYHVGDVLRAVLHSGTGRIRRPSSEASYESIAAPGAMSVLSGTR
jgi:hypothetical protein